MKRFLLAGGALLALTAAQPTLAADRPIYKAPPVVDPIFNWTGFYIGGNFGGAWGRSDTDSPLTNIGGGQQYIPSVVADINAQRFQRVNLSGVIGGAQAGFNVQVNNFVYGAEVDFNSFSLSGTSTASAFFTGFPGATPPTYTNSVSTSWLFTARGRVGFASANWLFYGTGGVAVTNLSYRHTFAEGVFGGTSSGVEASSVSATKVGYVVGGGFEYAWTRNWSLKAEYLYLNFGSVSSTAPVVFPGGPGTSIFNHTANLRVNVARIGLNYRFGP